MLLNNLQNNNKLYLLTANHNVDNGITLPFILARFKFKNTGCNSTDIYPEDYEIWTKAVDIVAQSTLSDFALIELDATGIDVSKLTFAGWSRNTVATMPVLSIGHPSVNGTPEQYPQRIAIGQSVSFYPNEFTNSDLEAPIPANNLWQVTHQGHRIAAGYSGGPLFNGNHQVIGQVVGAALGTAESCTKINNYKFYFFDAIINKSKTPRTTTITPKM